MCGLALVHTAILGHTLSSKLYGRGSPLQRQAPFSRLKPFCKLTWIMEFS